MKVLAKTDKGTYIIEVDAQEYEIIKGETGKTKLRRFSFNEWHDLAKPNQPLSVESMTRLHNSFSAKELCSASWVMDLGTYHRLRWWRYPDGGMLVEDGRPDMPLSFFGVPIEFVNYAEPVLGLKLDSSAKGVI